MPAIMQDGKYVGYVAVDLREVAKTLHDLLKAKAPDTSVLHITDDDEDKGRYHIELNGDHTLLYRVLPDGMVYIAKAFFNGTEELYGDDQGLTERRAVGVYQGAINFYQSSPAEPLN